MSITSEFKNSSSRMIDNCDMGSGSGMFGESVRLFVNADFSIVPGVSFTNPNRLVTFYNIEVQTGPNRILTLPNLANIARGYHCIITLTQASVGTLTISPSSGGTLANLNVGFSVLLVSVANNWIVNYMIPSTSIPGNTISYDSAGFPSITSVATELNRGKLTARTNTSPSVAGTGAVIVPYSSQLSIDSTTYTINAGTITTLRAGYYKIDATVTILITGLAVLTNTQVRLRLNGSTFPRTFQQQSNFNVPVNSGVYNLTANLFLAANTTFAVIVTQSVAITVGTIVAESGNCWIDAYYIGA